MEDRTDYASPFTGLEHARPGLRERVEQYRDELCRQMQSIVDQLQSLEHTLRIHADIQERVDARLNFIAYNEAADALVAADGPLALAARRMSFNHSNPSEA